MKKFFLIIKSELQRTLVYRLNISLYLGAHIFEICAQVVIWTAIFKTTDMVRGYNYYEMITYVIIAWFFMFFSSSYGFESKIAKEIHRGTLSNMITKPMNYLYYMTAVAIGRTVLAFFLILSLSIVIILIFQNLLIYPEYTRLVVLLLMLILSFFIKLSFSFMIGILSFWTKEVEGIYEMLDIIMKALSGAFFPLIFLPTVVGKINMFLPFAYTLYIPVQLYLGKISLGEGLIGLGVQCLWLVILFLLIKVLWKKGLKRYESAGA